MTNYNIIDIINKHIIKTLGEFILRKYSFLALLITVLLLSSCGGKVTTGTTDDEFALSYKLHENPKAFEKKDKTTTYETIGEYIKKNYYNKFDLSKFEIKDMLSEEGTGNLYFYRMEQDVVTTYYFELAFDKNKLTSLKEVGDMIIDPTLIDNKQPEFDAITRDYMVASATKKITSENQGKQVAVLDVKPVKRVNVPTKHFFYDVDILYTVASEGEEIQDKTETMRIELK